MRGLPLLQLDALPIESFDSVWPINEEGIPVYLKRIALPNTLSEASLTCKACRKGCRLCNERWSTRPIQESGASRAHIRELGNHLSLSREGVAHREDKTSESYTRAESFLTDYAKRFRGPKPPKVSVRKDIQIRIYSEIPVSGTAWK